MNPNFTPGAPLPADLGAQADLLHEVEELQRAMQKATDVVKSRASEIRDNLINNLSTGDTTGVAGKRYLAMVTTEEVPTIKDWQAFTAFIKANDRFDLVHKTVSKTATKDLWAAGVQVPGVEVFIAKKISLTKR